jgi:lipopolysaccharide biosynthesis glycosyltransferase
MTQAVIFALEDSKNEPNYEKLALIMIKSLLDTNPDIDIYCGIFTNRTPSNKTIQALKDSGVHVIEDIQFEVAEDSINYFLRNYCCYYFTHLNNLLERYDRIIYLDIDVIVLDSLDKIQIPNNSILVEQVPDNILEFEKPYIGSIDHSLYYNWISVLNNTNKHVYDIDYYNNTHLKQSDILVSQNINNSDLKIIDQTIGAYYPKHELSNNTVVFHYDGFIDSGSFYKLEEHNKLVYKKYFTYAVHILNIVQENDKSFWHGF